MPSTLIYVIFWTGRRVGKEGSDVKKKGSVAGCVFYRRRCNSCRRPWGYHCTWRDRSTFWYYLFLENTLWFQKGAQTLGLYMVLTVKERWICPEMRQRRWIKIGLNNIAENLRDPYYNDCWIRSFTSFHWTKAQEHDIIRLYACSPVCTRCRSLYFSKKVFQVANFNVHPLL